MKPYRFTLALCGATFLLLLVGGLVHPTGSSLACPDWPWCYGQVFPKMTGGILYEHSHRLLAFTVGCLTLVMAVMVDGRLRLRVRGWRLVLERRPVERSAYDRRTFRLAWFAPPLVLTQAVLGGITVLLKIQVVVTLAHLVNSMLFFALVIAIAWRLRPGAADARPAGIGSARTLVAVAAVGVILQILLGGIVRHTGAASACLDIPLCYGQVWPVNLHPAARIHMLHRIFGVTVGLLVVIASIAVYRRAAGQPLLRRLAILAPILVVVQVTLGVLNVLLRLPLPVITAHLGVAALLFAVHVWLLVASAVPAADASPAAARAGQLETA